MSFFIKNKNKRKQGPGGPTGGRKQTNDRPQGPQRKKRFRGYDEEIDSDSEAGREDEVIETKDKAYSSSEEEEETAQEKKLRLAKQYLAQIQTEELDKRGEDEEEIGRDIVSHRLKQDLLEQTGKLQRKVADLVIPPSADDLILFRGHQLSVTCVVISPDNKHVFSASKDCSIIKWSLADRKRVHTIPGGRKGTEEKHVGHTGHILAMALSSDGKYLATGDTVKLIHIWDAETCERVHTFRGHRNTVSGLTFRKDTHHLYSCSHDNSVKVWNVDERAYVETLFGHHDKITSIDSLARERAITAGGRDSTIRVWKLIEESQLVFNAHTIGVSIDCVALINESNFISGADDNSLSLWGVMKKKPYVTLHNAHGGMVPVGETSDAQVGQENWITAVAALHNTDMVSSGSRDGCVRVWKCDNDYKSLTLIFTVPVVGFVNSLRFSSDGRYLVAGVGQEHRLGRWWSNKNAKNGTVIIPLVINTDR